MGTTCSLDFSILVIGGEVVGRVGLDRHELIDASVLIPGPSKVISKRSPASMKFAGSRVKFTPDCF